MKKLLILSVIAFSFMFSTSAFGAQTYIGSYWVGDPDYAVPYTNNPSCYTPQEAAAFIFGGSAGEYVISTDRNVINFMGWAETWGNGSAHLLYFGGTPVAQDYKLQTGTGYDNPGGTDSAVSALVMDWDYYSSVPVELRSINYVWRVNGVPEPATLILIVLGLIGLSGLRRKI